MDKLKMIVAIGDTGSGERMARVLAEAGCQMNLQLAGRGTAKAAWAERGAGGTAKRSVQPSSSACFSAGP